MAQSSLAHSSRSIPYSQHFNCSLLRFTPHHDTLQAKPRPRSPRALHCQGASSGPEVDGLNHDQGFCLTAAVGHLQTNASKVLGAGHRAALQDIK